MAMSHFSKLVLSEKNQMRLSHKKNMMNTERLFPFLKKAMCLFLQQGQLEEQLFMMVNLLIIRILISYGLITMKGRS